MFLLSYLFYFLYTILAPYMITHTASIERFGEKGEKTGWTYVWIPFDVADQLNKGVKKSYRIKGKIDAIAIRQLSILPMGEGHFILPLKAELLKKIKKPLGETVVLTMEVDHSEKTLDEDLMLCLAEVPEAMKKFKAMPRSHQFYYSNHVSSAKTEVTKAKRIANIIESMLRNLTFAEMLKM